MKTLLHAFDPRGLGLVLRSTLFAGLAVVVLDKLGAFPNPAVSRGPVLLVVGAICGAGAMLSQGEGRGVWRLATLGVPLLLPVFVRALYLFALATTLLFLNHTGRGAIDVAWGLAGIALALRSLALSAVAGRDPWPPVLVPIALMGAVAVLLPDRPGLVLGPLAVMAWALWGFRLCWQRDGALVFEVGQTDGR